MKWLGYMYIKGFWVELASYRKFNSNRISGKCAQVYQVGQTGLLFILTEQWWSCWPYWQSVIKDRTSLIILTSREGPNFFLFTNGVNHVIHILSLGGRSPVLMSALNICDFLGPPGPKNNPKMAQNDHWGLSQ